ncbi:hypothetical protein SAMN04487914_101262 [Arthrobacter sp. ok909]|nr:hypothetical protein SAMN04487914_101262 [Arthrobacter sp. ok909]
MWWLDLDLASKEWLRENLRTIELPETVKRGIFDAGGAGSLTDADWDFIETQSEFVD